MRLSVEENKKKKCETAKFIALNKDRNKILKQPKRKYLFLALLAFYHECNDKDIKLCVHDE
jgi:hypothetical protein